MQTLKAAAMVAVLSAVLVTAALQPGPGQPETPPAFAALQSPPQAAPGVEGPSLPPSFSSDVFPPDKLVEMSVLVGTDTGWGTGVAFHNAGHRFVWTDAHVVRGCKSIVDVVDKAGAARKRVTFADVRVSQETRNGDRKTGSVGFLAGIVRYSERHDLALLKVRGDFPRASAVFAPDAPPVVGTALWHVGCMRGERGTNSVSDGVFAAYGRLRNGFVPDETVDPLVYDQVSMTVHPGSSGGGVYLKSNGQCVGLVTEFLGPERTFGAACITPTRRLREFCRDASCLWAVDASVAVPAKDDEPVMQDDIVLPEPEKKE